MFFCTAQDLCSFLFTVSAVHFTSSSGQWSCEFRQQRKQYETRISWDARGRYDTNPVLPLTYDVFECVCQCGHIMHLTLYPEYFMSTTHRETSTFLLSPAFQICHRLHLTEHPHSEKKKNTKRFLVHHGNGEGVWKICGKKSEQIWFHSKYRMMNASCNLELQEISNPVLYSCCIIILYYIWSISQVRSLWSGLRWGKMFLYCSEVALSFLRRLWLLGYWNINFDSELSAKIPV